MRMCSHILKKFFWKTSSLCAVFAVLLQYKEHKIQFNNLILSSYTLTMYFPVEWRLYITLGSCTFQLYMNLFRGILGTQSNLYEGAFLRKLWTVKIHWLYLQKNFIIHVWQSCKWIFIIINPISLNNLLSIFRLPLMHVVI